jgi:hypothetical protein
MNPRRADALQPGDIVRVSPRWGGPFASANQPTAGLIVHIAQVSTGDVFLVVRISSGGVMIDIQRPDGTIWSMEKADLLPLGDGQ